MGTYLNPSNQNFQENLSADIYVDKTGLIGQTNKVISTSDKYICVTRPRGFGKSMAADMLAAYYSKGCDSKELFDGLEISKSADFEKHLNRYDVIYLDITNFIDRAKDVPGMISVIEREVIHELKEAFPDVHEDSDRLDDWLYEISHGTGEQFVFVIDEWDCVLRERSKDENGYIAYLQFLGRLFKDRSYLALCYMTGIIPIRKTGDQSTMNMFEEYPVNDACSFAKYTGFTEDEVKALCERYNRSYEEIEGRYRGYNVEGLTVYNPADIVEALEDDEIKSYRAKIEERKTLKRCLKVKGVKDAVLSMLGGEKTEVWAARFSRRTDRLKNCNDSLMLMVHLGYLTYEYVDFREEWVWIPSGEMRKLFAAMLKIKG